MSIYDHMDFKDDDYMSSLRSADGDPGRGLRAQDRFVQMSKKDEVNNDRDFLESAAMGLKVTGKGISDGFNFGTREMYYRGMRTLSRSLGFVGDFDSWTEKIQELKDEQADDEFFEENPDVLEDELYRSLYEGFNSLVTSTVMGAPMAALGAGAAVATGGAAGIPALLGFALGSSGPAGLAEYDTFLDEAYEVAREKNAGITREEVEEQVNDSAVLSALAEGGFEAAGTVIGGKLLGFAGKFAKPGAKGFMKAADDFLDPKDISKFTTLLRNTLVRGPMSELPPEMATAAVQAELRNAEGFGGISGYQAAINAIGPTLVAGGAAGAAGATVSGLRSKYMETKTEGDKADSTLGLDENGKELFEAIKDEDPERARVRSGEYQSTLKIIADLKQVDTLKLKETIIDAETITDIDTTSKTSNKWERQTKRIIDRYTRDDTMMSIEQANADLMEFLPDDMLVDLKAWMRDGAKDPAVADALGKAPDVDPDLTPKEHKYLNDNFKKFLIEGIPENSVDTLMNRTENPLSIEESIAVSGFFEGDNTKIMDGLKKYILWRKNPSRKGAFAHKSVRDGLSKMRKNLVETYGKSFVDTYSKDAGIPEPVRKAFEKMRVAHVDLLGVTRLTRGLDDGRTDSAARFLGITGRQQGAFFMARDVKFSDTLAEISNAIAGNKIDPKKWDEAIAKGASSGVFNFKTRNLPKDMEGFMQGVVGSLDEVFDATMKEGRHKLSQLQEDAHAHLKRHGINPESLKSFAVRSKDLDRQVVYAKFTVDILGQMAMDAVELADTFQSDQALLDADNMLTMYQDALVYFKTGQAGIGRALSAFSVVNKNITPAMKKLADIGIPTEADGTYDRTVVTGNSKGGSKKTVHRSGSRKRMMHKLIQERGGKKVLSEKLQILRNLRENEKMSREEALIAANKGLIEKTSGALKSIVFNGLLSSPSTFGSIQLLSGGYNFMETVMTRLMASKMGGEVGIRSGEAKAMLAGLSGFWESIGVFKSVFAARVKGTPLRDIEGFSGNARPGGESLEFSDGLSSEALELSGGLGKAADYIARAIGLPGTTILAMDEMVKFNARKAEFNAQLVRVAHEVADASGESYESVLKRWSEGPPQWQLDAINRPHAKTKAPRHHAQIVGTKRHTQKVQEHHQKITTKEVNGKLVVDEKQDNPGPVYERELEGEDPSKQLPPPEGGWTPEELEVYKEILDESVDFSEYVTFQTPLTGAWAEADRLRKKVPFGQFIVPFFRTPVNVAKWISARTPVLANIMTDYNDVMKGDDMAKKQLYEARMNVGVILWTTAISIAANGMVTGDGPSDPDEREKLMNTGWRPNSLRVGDEYVQMSRLDPLGFFLTTAGNMMDIHEDVSDDDLMDASMAHLGLAFKMFSGDRVGLQGLTRLMEAMKDPRKNMGKFIEQQSSMFVPYSGALRTVRMAHTDPLMREVDGVFESVMNTVPGFSSELASRRNILGEKVNYDDKFGLDLLSPAKQSVVGGDEVSEEIFRLTRSRDEDDERMLRLRKMRAIVTDSKTNKKHKLSPKDFDRLQEIISSEVSLNGRNLKENLKELLKSSQYQSVTDKDKGELIERMVHEFRKKGREFFFSEQAENFL